MINFLAKKLTILMCFLMFYGILYSKTETIQVDKNLLIQFINTVRYVQYRDSLKTQIIAKQDTTITILQSNITLLNMNAKADSVIIATNKKYIESLQNIPFYKRRQFYTVYGALFVILIVIALK